MLLCYIFSVLLLSQGRVTANSLEEVDEKELQKLLAQEQYVAVLFSKSMNFTIFTFGRLNPHEGTKYFKI